MKIFLSCFQSNVNYNIPAYNFWQYYIKNGIIEAGHIYYEDDSIDWAYGYAIKDKNLNEKWKAGTWDKTIKYLCQNKVDVFFSYLYPEQIDTNALKYISNELGIPTINFFCDNLRDFVKVPEEFYPFSMHWVPEFDALSMYRNFNHIHLPMPMWIDEKYRKPVENENDEISFIGSKDYFRNTYFLNIFSKSPELSSKIKIYGAGWENEQLPNSNNFQKESFIKNQIKFISNEGLLAYKNKILYMLTNSNRTFQTYGKISDLEYINITKESKITLGINSVESFRYSPFNPLKYSRLRDIEVPMIGGCFLTEETSDILQFYDVGLDVYTYKTIDELVWKLNELSNNKGLRNMLRKNGQSKALNELSIPKSLDKLFFKL